MKGLPPRRALLEGAALAAAYVLAGKVGLSFAVVDPSASAVWAPSGLAIGALLARGRHLWPGVLVGAFVVNLGVSPAIPALAIACGNTLEAVLAVTLVQRYAGGTAAFDRPAGILRFGLLAAVIATMASATVGVATLVVEGVATKTSAPNVWLTWWLGDATGTVLVAPAVVLALRRPRDAPIPWRALAAGLAVTLLSTVVVFGGLLPEAYGKGPTAWLAIPAIVWAAFLLPPWLATLPAIVLSISAVAGTALGEGPFSLVPDANVRLLLVQLFAALSMLIALTVATSVSHLKRVLAALRGDSVEALRREMDERALASGRLETALEVAELGSWEIDVARGSVRADARVLAILGISPQEIGGGGELPDVAAFTQRADPADQGSLQRALHATLVAGEPLATSFRTRQGDRVAHVEVRARLVRVADGSPARVVGTMQDVTSRVQAVATLRRQAMTRAAARRVITALARGPAASPAAVRAAGQRFAEDAEGTTLPTLLERFVDLGLGELTLERQEGDRFVFRGRDLIERASAAPRPTCTMTLGFLEGVVARAAGGTALGSEIRCQSRGHPACEFVVSARPAQTPGVGRGRAGRGPNAPRS